MQRPRPPRPPVALDPEAIRKLVTRRFRDRCYVQHNLPPLRLSTGEILANLTDVMAKLAETGAREGTDGPCWGHWLACAEAAGGPPGEAVGRLLEHEAHWLASWCWLNDRDELGVAAYEQFLASKRVIRTDLGGTETARIGFNPFATFPFVAAALRLGLEGRALRALEPVCEGLGSRASDDILLALLRYKAGKLESAAARKVIARFARSSTDLDHAARAIALQELGDEVAARAVVAGFDRETSFPPTAEQEMVKRFGIVYEHAIARARTARPKRPRSTGYVVLPSRAKSPHVFAPDLPRGPACPGCGRPSRVWFSFDLSKATARALESAVWRRFHATACLDCDAWMRRHDHAVREDGGLELVDVEPGVKSLPRTAYSQDSTRPITPQFARLVKAPRELHERPLEGDCQLGGDPAWIQDPVDVHCGRCTKTMTFVFRLSAPQPFADFPIVAGDSGALYYFVCRTCPRSTHIAQWT